MCANLTLDPAVPFRVRQAIGPWLTRLARTLGQPEYQLRDTEYVGTVHRPLDEVTETLRSAGFEWDPLAWYHQPPVGADPDGSWTYRPSPLADRQIHVILIGHARGYVDVFAHEEYNWLRHPVKHLRQVGIERERGSTEVRAWFDAYGIDCSGKPRGQRRFARYVRRIRDRAADALLSR